MWFISTETKFSAAHHLRGYPGECREIHGHNFKVQITVASTKLKKEGFVMDFRGLKQELNEVVKYFDHRNLNELPEFKKINPSSENIAKIIWERVSKNIKSPIVLKEIKVWESETNSVIYQEK